MFVVILIFILLLNFGYAGLQASLLRRRNYTPQWLIRALYLWAFLACFFLLLQVFVPTMLESYARNWLYWPLAVAMVWNLLLLVIVPVLILRLLYVRRAERIAARAPAPSVAPDEISRRKFVYLVSCGALPATAMALGTYGSLTSSHMRVNRLDIPISGLPPELEGFTIAHVSDLHSGIFVGPERLKYISDTTNDLKADLIVVTGDLINRSMGEFPDVLASIKAMESRYGIYLCEGNHDVFPGPGLVAAACAENNLRMLRNATAILPVNNRRLVIGGVPWTSEEPPEMVSSLFPARQEGDVRILLAHHPHLFDAADSADLVLSGHTHGGQIMIGDVGLGRLRFKYCSGLFSRGNTTLIVNNGCGDWFPCRIGAPAEIGLLRLVKAQTA